MQYSELNINQKISVKHMLGEYKVSFLPDKLISLVILKRFPINAFFRHKKTHKST